MKRKILTCTIVAVLVVLIATTSILTGCVNQNFNDTTMLGIMADKTTAYKGDTVNLTVFVRPEGAYTVSANPANLVEIHGNSVKFVGDIQQDTDVTITATLNSNSNVKDSCVVKYKAPAVQEEKTKITITSDKNSGVKGETINFTVTVDPVADYILTAEPKELVVIGADQKSATFVGDITLDKFVKFTAVLVDDNTVKASTGVTYKAPTIAGQVGELTSGMIEAVGNQSITVQGTVTDYVVDFNNALNSSENTMEMLVKMEDGKWFGTWNYVNARENAIEDLYERGEGYVVGFDGSEGNPLWKVYVNKDNQVARKVIKNYESKPATWQSQHMWNHLSQLDVNTFYYDAEKEIYIHELDVNNEDDLYLMTYLSYSLTPMLEDTLDMISFKVEGGKIVSMIAQTEIIYDRGQTTDPSKASMMSYTQVEVTFYDVGTTTVKLVETYEAPEFVEYLEQALETIKGATNYTFKSVEHQTSAPSVDEGDYELQSTSAKDYVSAVGTVGIVGYVTEESILIAETGKYSASLDNKNYWTKYSGYKQNDNNTIDYFTYSSSDNALKGTKKIKGTISDILPKFEFSVNIFKFEGSTSRNGVNYYTFTLRDGAITRDVSMQISMHGNADDGEASVSSKLTIIVDDKGNLVSTSFPYSITFGTYIGYITTTYSNLGTTTIAEDTFDGYVPRVWSDSWSDYLCKYYTANPGVEWGHDENAQIALDAAFPGMTVPSPMLFLDVFGDNFYGPFFDWEEAGTDADGNKTFKYYISINAEWVIDLDENMKITDYDVIYDKILEVFGAYGYVKDKANSADLGYKEWFTIYNNETNMEIVFENIGSHFFYIHLYVLGDWTLNA